MRRSSYLVLFLLTVTPGLLSAEEVSVEFALVRNKIVVPVSLNGAAPYPFILDTCAAHSVVDRDVATYLQLPVAPDMRVETRDATGNIVVADRVSIEAFGLAGLPPAPTPFLAMDLHPFLGQLGTKVAGIFSGREIGAEIAVDFSKRFVTVRREENMILRNETSPHVTPLRFSERGMPMVDAIIDDQHVLPFAIDTASSATVAVPEDTLKTLGILDKSTPRLSVDATGAGFSSIDGKTQIRLGRIAIGEAAVLDPICAMLEPGDTPRLGIGFFKYMKLTIDFNEKRAQIEPATLTTPREPHITGCGLCPARFDGSHWSLWVAKDSPAAWAGLVSGAILMSINGQEMENKPYESVSESLDIGNGAAVNVCVLQGGTMRTVTLTGAKLL